MAVVVRLGGGQSSGGTVFGQAAGSRDPKDPIPPPSVVLTPEHYNRVLRLLDKKIPVKLEFEIQAKFLDDRTDSVNVIGEIPGGRKRDEIVMIGAHLDSWQGGTGATDNAAGCAVMIEVMRILKTLNLPMDRTVRMALWGGEEQGLLGSRAYVNEHFATREDMKPKPEHAKLSGYFNVDNGSGKIRGVYLQGNDAMRPVFRGVVQAVPGPWRRDHQHPRYRWHGSSELRRRGFAGIPVHSGRPGIQFADAPFQYGRVRSRPAGRHGADGGDRGVVRIQRGDSRRIAPAGAAAEAATCGAEWARRCSVERRATGELIRGP